MRAGLRTAAASRCCRVSCMTVSMPTTNVRPTIFVSTTTPPVSSAGPRGRAHASRPCYTLIRAGGITEAICRYAATLANINMLRDDVQKVGLQCTVYGHCVGEQKRTPAHGFGQVCDDTQSGIRFDHHSELIKECA